MAVPELSVAVQGCHVTSLVPPVLQAVVKAASGGHTTFGGVVSTTEGITTLC